MAKQVKARTSKRRARMSPHRMQIVMRELRERFIRDLILRGFQPDDVLYSENEVVEHYQTTLAAARRLYQQLEDDGVVRRVRGHGTTLLRLPHMAPHKPVILLLATQSMNDASPWLTEYLGGLEGTLADYGVHGRSYSPDDLGPGGLELLSEVGGVVVCPYAGDAPPSGFEAALCDLYRRQVNVVQVCGTLAGLPNVAFDESDAGAKAMQHLLNYGHRAVTFIGFADCPFDGAQNERIAGAQKAAKAAGSDVDLTIHRLDLPLHGVPDKPADCPGLDKVLQKERKRQTTAVIAANDSAASHVWREAQALGLHVPSDLSIVGFDDNIEWRRYSITTARYPWGELGQQAARHLLTLDPAASQTDVRVDTRLMLRSTTAPRARTS